MSEIHQTLHGYSEGHRLLAASLRLPRDAERTLLILADISGPVTAGAFDTYLTGYAVPGTSAYALARTWLATELNRPACVWTHTLLIDHADLSHIPDLRVLPGLFRRPRKGESSQTYAQPLALPAPPSGLEGPGQPLWSERDGAWVLAALYGVPDAPAFLEADRPDRLEDLVLAVWTQQWPRLRRTFRFCTWSLTGRSIEGDPFDLQVVPPAVSRQLQRGPLNGTIVPLNPRFGDEPKSPAVPSWARVAARDLVAASDGALRRFLSEFGVDAPAPRRAFAPLVEIEDQVAQLPHGGSSLAQLVDLVAARFPSAQEGRRLKAALFGERAAREEGLLSTVGEADLLRELAATGRQSALDADALALRRRGTALWRTERGPARELALRIAEADHPSPLGEQILDGVAEAMGPSDCAAIREQSPRLFAGLVKRNPSLAAPGPAAPRPAADERETPRTAASPEEPTGSRVAAGVEAARGVDRAPAPAPPRREEPETVAAILDRLDRQDGLEHAGDLDAGRRRALEAHPGEVVGWFMRAEAPKAPTVAVVASVLRPDAPELHRIGTESWLRATAGIEDRLDKQAHIRLMAFLLSLAFRHPDPTAAELAARAFETVDRAATSGELPPDAWALLADQLPALPWWRDWDRCERLRRGLIERFVRGRWSPGHLLRAAPDDATFQRIVEICEWTRDGEAFLRRLAGLVSRASLEATRVQRAVLARYA